MTETKRARAAFNAAYNTIESTEAEFKKVAQILASASDIGVKHSLWKEWNDLRKVSVLVSTQHIHRGLHNNLIVMATNHPGFQDQRPSMCDSYARYGVDCFCEAPQVDSVGIRPSVVVLYHCYLKSIFRRETTRYWCFS